MEKNRCASITYSCVNSFSPAHSNSSIVEPEPNECWNLSSAFMSATCSFVTRGPIPPCTTNTFSSSTAATGRATHTYIHSYIHFRSLSKSLYTKVYMVVGKCLLLFSNIAILITQLSHIHTYIHACIHTFQVFVKVALYKGVHGSW